MKLNTLAAMAGLGLALGAGPANAAFITGALTVSDGVLPSSLPTAPSTSIVHDLTGIQHDGNGNSSGCTGTFAAEATCTPGSLNAAMTNWVFAGPFPNIIVVDGFTFDLTSASGRTEGAFTCSATDPGSCNDTLSGISLVGTVSGNGYDPTTFTGSLSFSGSCTKTVGANTCGGNYSAGYTYSLAAIGSPPRVPEPGTLALLGLGLLGLGASRRRKSA